MQNQGQNQAMLQVTNAGLIATARDWCVAGHKLAVALVIETWGSSPRPVGSIMVIREDGEIAGSVSGGCVEAAVIEAGCEAMVTQQGQQLTFGVADAMAWEVGLSCGGRIAVLVTPVGDKGLPGDILVKMAAAADQRETINIPFDATTGAVGPMQPTGSQIASGLDRTGRIFHFYQPPPRRLFIIGGVHIAQTLAPMAAQIGYAVTVIDPRAVFASPLRFPGTETIIGWPDEMLADITLDQTSALVTLTHDPKIDDPALIVALQQSPFYIASLGSRRTHAARCARLHEAGFESNQIDRIDGPAGLDIGAQTPAEIAVSILAQLIAVQRPPGAA